MVGKPAPAAFEVQRNVLAVVYPFVVCAARQFRYGHPPFESFDDAVPKDRRREFLQQASGWLDEVDRKIAVHELRRLLQSSAFNGAEIAQALIHRYFSKPEK